MLSIIGTGCMLKCLRAKCNVDKWWAKQPRMHRKEAQLCAACTARVQKRKKEGYKGRQRACMSESGHCSRKSDPNPGHPENIYATVPWQTARWLYSESLGPVYEYFCTFTINVGYIDVGSAHRRVDVTQYVVLKAMQNFASLAICTLYNIGPFLRDR